MGDKVEATYHGESAVMKAVRLRIAYDANSSGQNAAAWLDAENALTVNEYHEYRAAYEAQK